MEWIEGVVEGGLWDEGKGQSSSPPPWGEREGDCCCAESLPPTGLGVGKMRSTTLSGWAGACEALCQGIPTNVGAPLPLCPGQRMSVAGASPSPAQPLPPTKKKWTAASHMG